MAEGFVTRRGGTPAPFQPLEATGGTVTDVNIGGTDYRIHAFTSTGTSTFEVTSLGNNADVNADYLIVAGGGGGGSSHTSSSLAGGGGGAGGLIYGRLALTQTSYSITVGSGGAGNDGPETNSTSGDMLTNFPNVTGENGENSIAFGLTAIGGGGGATRNAHENGKNGGSGGGAAGTGDTTTRIGGSGVSGQGNDGGDNSAEWGAAGGGGAGGPGLSTTGGIGSRINAAGGPGLDYSSIFTTNYGDNGYFAGGGGGGGHNDNGTRTGAAGGIGGGARGGNHPSETTAPSAQNNTGGGGGGAIGWNGNEVDSNGGDGGSGIVLIRYRLDPEDIISNGLIVHLDANTSSGSTWTDLSANNNNFTLVNSPTYNSGGWFDFNGSNQYATINNLGLSDHTIEGWFNSDLSSAGSGGDAAVIFGNYGGGTDKYTFIGIENSVLTFKIDDGNNSFTTVDTETFSANNWYHVALTYNSNGTVKSYVNGSLTDTLNYTSNITFDSLPTTVAHNSTGFYFDGQVAIHRIYDRALNDTEIQENFDIEKSRFGL